MGKGIQRCFFAFIKGSTVKDYRNITTISTNNKNSNKGKLKWRSIFDCNSYFRRWYIVTDEGNKNNGISMVCESLGVEYMKLNDMLDEVLE